MAETKKCPHCGGEILSIAKKCKHCGNWINEEYGKLDSSKIKCPFCSEIIPADSEVCPECDERLTSAKSPTSSLSTASAVQTPVAPAETIITSTPAAIATPTATTSQSWYKNPWIWVSVLILVILSIFLYIVVKPDFNRNKHSAVDTEGFESTVSAPSQQVPAAEILKSWDKAHNTQDAKLLCKIYAKSVYYYQTSYNLSKVISSKQTLFEKNPSFHQESINVKVSQNNDGTYRLDFDKLVWVDYPYGESKSYPSYLFVKKVSSKWKICTESDLVTDANLAKRRNKNN